MRASFARSSATGASSASGSAAAALSAASARRGRAFVGFAHSHPGGACAPSMRDRETLWPDCVQLITDGADVRAFRLGRDGAVHPLTLLAAEARR